MDLNRIQGLFKKTTKIQDFFKIVRTMERVWRMAVRTCEKNVGGGGGGGGTWAKGGGGGGELGQRWLVAIPKWKIRI